MSDELPIHTCLHPGCEVALIGQPVCSQHSLRYSVGELTRMTRELQEGHQMPAPRTQAVRARA
jgi:hypothetical protein